MLLRTPSAASQILPDAGHLAGTITGQVIDPVGAPVSGAVVTLEQEGDRSSTETVSAADGRFAFVNVNSRRARLRPWRRLV
jgi:hypothetical protein